MSRWHRKVEKQELVTRQKFLTENVKIKEMMAMLWAQQIMLGKKTYSQVPRLLKDKVKEILIDSGAEDLVTGEQKQ